MMHEQNEMEWVTFADIKRLFLRHSRKMWQTAVLCALCTCAICLVISPRYLAEATFNQECSQTPESFGIQQMLQRMTSAPFESSAFSLMQSQKLLKSTLSELGMQAHVQTKSYFSQKLTCVFENLRLLLGFNLNDPEDFVFRNIAFSHEKREKFILRPLSMDTYELSSSDHTVLGTGSLGTPFSCDTVAFTLMTFPKTMKIGAAYSLFFSPWQDIVTAIRSHLTIRSLKADPHVLTLAFSHRDRKFAASFLNQLMKTYQTYLYNENEEVTRAQLAYLHQRNQEMTAQLDKNLREHVDYIKEGVKQHVYLESEEEGVHLAKTREDCLSQLFDIDLEIKRLSRFEAPSSFASSDFQPLASEIQEVDKHIQEATTLLSAVEEKREIPSEISLLQNPKTLMALLTRNFQENLAKNQEEARVVFTHEMRSYLQHLSNKQVSLTHSLHAKQNGLSHLADFNLAAAQNALNQCISDRDRAEAQLLEMIFLRDQLNNPEFEISSLGAVFSDAITTGLLQKAGDLALQLKEDHNRSLRDCERLQETLLTQKRFLSQHLFQTIELTKLRSQLLEDKIAHLRQSTLQLLHAEKGHLNQKIEELNSQMEQLPDRWRRESLLTVQKEVGIRMLEGLSQLSETKSIHQHLYHVNSKPLDLSFPPTQARSSQVIIFGLIALFAGGFLSFAYYFLRALFQGFPLSLEQLKLSGFNCMGTFSDQNSNLETLRKAAQFLLRRTESPLCAALLSGSYSSDLAELLSLSGRKVILMHYLLNETVYPHDRPGVWQYLNGEIDNIPLRNAAHYSTIPSGGITANAAEWLSHPRFALLIQQLKSQCDILLIHSNASADSVEASLFFSHVDVMLATVQQEKKSALSLLREKGDRAAVIYKEATART